MPQRRTCAFLAVLLPLALAAPGLRAQGGDGRIRAVTTRAEPVGVKPGETLSLRVRIEIDEGWHIYSVKPSADGYPTTFRLDDGPFELAGPVTEPAPKRHRDEYTEYEYHEGSVEFTLPVRLAAAATGRVAVKGVVDLQPCDATSCASPRTVSFRADVMVEGTVSPGAESAPAEADAPAEIDPVAVLGATIEPRSLRAGDRFAFRVRVRMAPTWHIYHWENGIAIVPTTFGPAGGSPWRMTGSPSADREPVRIREPLATYDYYEGEVEFTIPAVLLGTATPGAVALRGVMNYMPCDPDRCLMETEKPFEAAVDVAAGGGPPPPDDDLRILATLDRAKAPPGSTVHLEVTVTAAPGRRIPAPGSGPDAPALRIESFEQLADRGAPEVVLAEPGRVRFRVPLRLLERDVKEGETVIRGEVIATTILPGAMPRAASAAFKVALDIRHTLFGYIWLAVLTGLFVLLTPCVYPLIPVTISYFSKQALRTGKPAVGLALAYGLGIIASFLALGAILNVGAAEFAAHWMTQGFIGVLFVVFALSLFGLFDLRPPAFLMNLGGGRREGLAGALLLGLLFAATSFACSVPFLATLVLGASQGDWGRYAVGMLFFSLPLAVPFVVLALFPGLVTSLPKSGGWMDRIKVSMGFVELMMAMKFLGGMDQGLPKPPEIFTRTAVLASWIAGLSLTGFYLIGFFRFPKEAPREGVGVMSAIVAFLCFSGAIVLVDGLDGDPLGSRDLDGFLPVVEKAKHPDQRRLELQRTIREVLDVPRVGAAPSPLTHGAGTGAVSGGRPIGYLNRITNDWPAALALARERDVPLFLDATGFN